VVKLLWVYKTKFSSKGVFERHKTHLVAKEFYQQEGTNYTKTFTLLVKMKYNQIILSFDDYFGWQVHQ
jgi:hypothetical protein